MKWAVSDAAELSVSPIALGDRLAAYVELTKPRITFMVLLTVAVGYVLGTRGFGAWSTTQFLLTLIGAGLVASGASAWNQLLERSTDALMRRTAKRPLPSGKIQPVEALLLGTMTTALGLAILLVGANALSAVVAGSTFFLYVFVYTPLKLKTTLNTVIGAVPGALPPLIGWASATDQLGMEGWALFLIVFLWQFPHFLAIAWIYRRDYAGAGYRMLPSKDPEGWETGRHAVTYALALIPVALMPVTIGLAGTVYLIAVSALSIFYLACAMRFWADVSDATARRLLRASIVHLPATLLLLLLNPLFG
ncbi:MAG: heme o synthase [Isosphaeraceae bacterium]